MKVKHLVIGLDGADLDLIDSLGAERLPNLFSLMRRGVFARTQVVQPPATLPNWATFLTGVDPGQHGVFDFTTRHGYKVRFTGGTARQVPTFVSRLDQLGMRCACIGFPGTWPPEKLKRGIFMSGWDAPVSFKADSSFVWPPSLYDQILEKWGPLYFDDVNEFDADKPDWHQTLPEALCARIQRKVALTKWLMDLQQENALDWDLFAVYFGESDTASHYLWSLHDTKSPRHPRGVLEKERNGLLQVYQSLDGAVGKLIQHASDNACSDKVEITLVSDHGSGGSSDKVLFLNRYLEQSGLLKFKRKQKTNKMVQRLKEVALTRFPPSLKERIFRAWDTYLPSMLESNARFGAIDMKQTVAFSDELNYFPSIHINVKGREPHGLVEMCDYTSTVLEIKRALFELKDPWTKKPVVAQIWHREDLFDGPFLERAPDLLLELHLDDHYSYNLMPTFSSYPSMNSALSAQQCWRKLRPEEYLGRKGRSLPGSHRSKGTWIAAGPSVKAFGEVEAKIEDTTATLLHRMGVAIPPEFNGKVIWNALVPESAQTNTEPLSALPSTQISTSTDLQNQKNSTLVESRLRALGYID